MKTKKFSDQQLEDLVEKGETVTCEPVKEGEDIELWKCSNCGYEIRKPPIDKILKNPYYRELFINNKNEQIKPCPNDCARTISENKISGLKKYAYSDLMVGELVQALNEKGEKQWYCPLCKRIGIGLMGINFECGCLTLHREEDEHWNPLVVRLQKIEKKEILIGECDSGKPILEENWLKTWVRI